MTVSEKDMELQLAIAQGHALFLSIHNQKAFILGDTAEGSNDRLAMTRFSATLEDYKNLISYRMITVNGQFEICALNEGRRERMAKKSWRGNYENYYPELILPYDDVNYILDKNSQNIMARENYIDIVMPPENQHVFISPYQNMFHGKTGDKFSESMKDKGITIIIGAGAYSSACVPSTLIGAVEKGFSAYALTDLIFTHPTRLRLDKNAHHNIIKDYPAQISRITSERLMQLT